MTRDNSLEPTDLKPLGAVTAQDLFDVLMVEIGANEYTAPKAGLDEAHRFELHQIAAATALCAVLRYKRRWKAAYALGVWFDDKKQDFIEVDEQSLPTDVSSFEAFERFARLPAQVQYWRDALDTLRALGASGGKDRPWQSAIVVYAGRFGAGPQATSSSTILPLKNDRGLVIAARNICSAVKKHVQSEVSQDGGLPRKRAALAAH